MRREFGFSYLGILFAIAITSVALAGMSVLWSMERKREKEAELIAIGMEFQRAISLYYGRSPGAVKRYPRSLDDLLEDKRFLTPQRYLRQIYVDPMTGKREWSLIQAPEGGFMGVHSTSSEPPLKRVGLPAALEVPESASRYSDWRFIYRSRSSY